MQSRRLFMGATAALSAAPFIGQISAARAATVMSSEILALFQAVPGETSIKIWAPTTDDKPALDIAHNASTRMFVGSAIKAFVMAEASGLLTAPHSIRQT
jgi:beta-lactamase class A